MCMQTGAPLRQYAGLYVRVRRSTAGCVRYSTQANRVSLTAACDIIMPVANAVSYVIGWTTGAMACPDHAIMITAASSSSLSTRTLWGATGIELAFRKRRLPQQLQAMLLGQL